MIAGDIDASRAMAVRIGEVSAHVALRPKSSNCAPPCRRRSSTPTSRGRWFRRRSKGAVHIFAAAPTAPLWRCLSPCCSPLPVPRSPRLAACPAIFRQATPSRTSCARRVRR